MLLARMARLGRALGFHIIAATQRPAVDMVPGPIKSQLLARCCFKVASGTESRVVLGEDNSAGAELPAQPGRGIWQWGEPVVFPGPAAEARGRRGDAGARRRFSHSRAGGA